MTVKIKVPDLPYIEFFNIYTSYILILKHCYSGCKIYSNAINMGIYLNCFEFEPHSWNHRSVASPWQTLSNNVVSSTLRHEWGSNSKQFKYIPIFITSPNTKSFPVANNKNCVSIIHKGSTEMHLQSLAYGIIPKFWIKSM
jgi:hypothetical protein